MHLMRTATLAEVIDPLDYALVEARRARTDLAAHIAAAVTFDDAIRVWDELRALRDEFDTLATLAGAQVDAISLRS